MSFVLTKLMKKIRMSSSIIALNRNLDRKHYQCYSMESPYNADNNLKDLS